MSLRPEPREPVPEETGGPQKLSYIAERPCSPGNIHDATRKDWTRHSPIFRLTIDRFIGIISSRYKKSHIKLDLLGHSMKRLMTELTPKPVQILEYLTPCAQEQCYPPIFQELAHGLNLTEKHTRGGVHILEHEGLSAPAAIDDLRLSLQKPLPTALLHDLPLVGRGSWLASRSRCLGLTRGSQFPRGCCGAARITSRQCGAIRSSCRYRSP
jgi:hypothetical protein